MSNFAPIPVQTLKEFSHDGGDVFTIDSFIESVEMGEISPYDGSAGRLIIDGMITNLYLSHFGQAYDPSAVFVHMKFVKTHFKDHSVKVVWYNK